jgi:hypothetical protein
LQAGEFGFLVGQRETLYREAVEAGEEEPGEGLCRLGELVTGALGGLGHQLRRHGGHLTVVALKGLLEPGCEEGEHGQFGEQLMGGRLFAQGLPQSGGQCGDRLLETGVRRGGPLDL